MRKNIYHITFVTVAVAGTLLVLGSTKTPTSSKSAPCKESIQECCKKPEGKNDNMIYESLSGQFFTSAIMP
jgi:hypothetical protein